jgi:hypothetical protein
MVNDAGRVVEKPMVVVNLRVDERSPQRRLGSIHARLRAVAYNFSNGSGIERSHLTSKLSISCNSTTMHHCIKLSHPSSDLNSTSVNSLTHASETP